MESTIRLGDVARDTITGYSGIVICRSEWLFGCVRLTLQAKGLTEGKPLESHTADLQSCELVRSATETAARDVGGPQPAPTRPATPPR